MELIKKENHFQILSKSVKEVEVSTWKWFEIEWYASTKDKDRYWDIVEPTAFKKAMKQYSQNPIILLQHNPDKPIWKVNEFSIDNNGLYIKALITEDTDGVFSKIQNNILKWFSIWFCLKDFELEEQEDWNYVNVIKDLANDGMTMLVVTHEMNFAKNVSNKVKNIIFPIIFSQSRHFICLKHTFSKDWRYTINNCFISSIC